MSDSILAYLNLIGAAQGAFLALFFACKKEGKKHSNRLLAAVLLVMSIVIFNTGYILLDGMLFQHVLQLVANALTFAMGPLLYFYVQSLTQTSYRLDRKKWLHFIPFLLCLILRNVNPVHAASVLWMALWKTQLATYLFFAIRSLNTFRRTVTDDPTQSKHISWMKTILYGIVISAGLNAVLFLVSISVYAVSWQLRLNLTLLLAIHVYIIAYKELSKRDQEMRAKYESSNLSAEMSAEYLNRITKVMETDKLYRKPDLTIQQLSRHTGIQSRHISQVINSQLSQNFSEFVNQFRVEEVKKHLLDPEKQYLTILSIARDAGFTAGSNFNTFFKKMTKMTPSEYQSKNGKHEKQ